MPNQTTSKRVPLSLSPQLYEIISDLSELQNKPMSRVIVELLEEMQPVLSSVRDGLQEVKDSNDPKSVLKRLGQELVLSGTEQLGSISREVKDL
jgi:hypothetical protein